MPRQLAVVWGGEGCARNSGRGTGRGSSSEGAVGSVDTGTNRQREEEFAEHTRTRRGVVQILPFGMCLVADGSNQIPDGCKILVFSGGSNQADAYKILFSYLII